MMKRPRVTALIATADRGGLLWERSVPSMLSQSLLPDTLLIVDDSKVRQQGPLLGAPSPNVSGSRQASCSSDFPITTQMLHTQDAVTRGQNRSHFATRFRQQEGTSEAVYLQTSVPGSGAAAFWNTGLADLEGTNIRRHLRDAASSEGLANTEDPAAGEYVAILGMLPSRSLTSSFNVATTTFYCGHETMQFYSDEAVHETMSVVSTVVTKMWLHFRLRPSRIGCWCALL